MSSSSARLRTAREFADMKVPCYLRTCMVVAVLSGTLVLPALSATSASRVSFVTSQVPRTKVLKETLFSRKKCAVRMARCFTGQFSVHVLVRIAVTVHVNPYCPPSLAARKDYVILLRKYVSRRSAGKGRAVLEYVGFDGSEIEMFYVKKQKDEEEAVHSGLLEWASGKAKGRPTTWEILIGAMVHAEISVQYIDELKKELQKGVYTFAYTYVSVHSLLANGVIMLCQVMKCIV